MTDTTYSELLEIIDEFAAKLDPHERMRRLYGLIAPLLDRVEREDEELSDEPVLSTPDAVRGIRKAAAGEPIDLDAVHEQLTEVGLCYSEDQDPERHVVSQSAYAAAAWLRLLAGRKLRTTRYLEGEDEDPVPPFAPSAFTRIVDLLAWTRSNQVYVHWEDALTYSEEFDLPAATHQLRTMHREVTA
ncbi:hypothetical protein [Streptomyces rapamycinicus]|uniref:Uncharacterized protein n=2 Tax=Streptomyces rapamycinicus TaxID=1226757 RepID=A0A0A0NJP3_STRRN|nr:hypothetical protein [Streptomyces rapamycinicus]AGP59787.1 hypothetical protein M271_42055 [Streptomyces rapamycinicus NRRL 5491]MBB4789056.1 hypothetical protein [Streptomyces rapamycinicus]RLV77026.1 hypothetical protein D3C57_101615 [Streptomyces rapamycinicus NRRL 5491]UTO67472.1 hypothetical protein LJB45_37635 [Streptomyces rapamycinicus]UTP35426.1 hypothetical protein LIV37_42770 [Streptomyces rapamycinicus NRRL 5491]